MRKALLLPLFVLAAPAFAGTFAAPAGCTAHLTVQSRGCTVSHFYTCEADPKGNQWRADFGVDGQFYLSMIDSETQWIESYELDVASANPTSKETLDPNPKDAASFSDLLSTGLDTFDFNLSKDTGERTHVTGFDQLTGKTATIDGMTLSQTEYEYTQTDDKGTVLRHSKGHEFISEEFRSFFSGSSNWQADDGTWITIEGAPISFIKPGEPGFDSTKPLFECDAQMSSFTPTPDLSPSLKDPQDDNL
jgi:hypothetical protein